MGGGFDPVKGARDRDSIDIGSRCQHGFFPSCDMELNLDLRHAGKITMPCHCCTTPEIEIACTKRILEWYHVDQIIIPARCHLLRDEMRLGWLVDKAEFDESEIAIIDRLRHGWIAKELLVSSIDIIEIVEAIPLP